jgi:esterase/lipase superfamily enzyme
MEESLEAKRRVESDLNSKSHLRDELEKYGLEVDDLSKLADGARFFKDSKFSVEEMLMKFSSFMPLQARNSDWSF